MPYWRGSIGSKTGPELISKIHYLKKNHCRYASYCANVGRTYFVDPNKEMEEQYAAVNAAHAAAIAALVEGAPMSAAYAAAAQTLKVGLFLSHCPHRIVL